MRLCELFEGIDQKYLNNPDEIDERFNGVALSFARDEREWREKQGPGVILKPLPQEKETKFSTVPKDKNSSSAGHTGLQIALDRTKKKST